MTEQEARERLVQLRYLQRQVEAEITMLQLRLSKKGRRVRRTQLEHGTDSGYYWHLNKQIPFPEDEGGKACGCRRAHTANEKRRAMVRRARRALEPS